MTFSHYLYALNLNISYMLCNNKKKLCKYVSNLFVYFYNYVFLLYDMVLKIKTKVYYKNDIIHYMIKTSNKCCILVQNVQNLLHEKTSQCSLYTKY